MPNIPITPPNKRVDELTTEITFSTFERFEDEKNFNKRSNEMITYLIKELAIERAKIEIYENSKE